MTATMTAPKELQELQTAGVGVAKELDKHVLCCAITVHMWRGQYKVRDASVRVGEVAVEKSIVTDPRWKLMPETWSVKFSKVEQSINNLVDSNRPLNSETFKFPLKGVDIIPRKSAPALFKKIREIEEKVFNPLVDQFAAALPELTAALREKIGEANYRLISSYIPSDPHKIRERFRIEKHVVPIRFSDEKGFAEYMGKDVDEFSKEIGQYVKQFATSTAETIVAGLQEELTNAVNNLQERIHDKGIIKGATLDMVQRAFEKIRGFDFFMTPELLAKVEAVDKVIKATDHQDLNRDIKGGGVDIAAKLSGALSELTSQCQADAASMAVFGRGRRSLG